MLLAPAVELAADLIVIGSKISRARAAACSGEMPRLPGIGVRSLLVAIELASPSSRLQSITRRE